MTWLDEQKPPANPEVLLERLILSDQRTAVLRSILIAVPVNIALGIIITIVSIHVGNELVGLVWFAASTIVNILRITLSLVLLKHEPDENARSGAWSAEQHLRLSWITALASGFAWSFIPILCGGYTTPSTLFYLTVVCGTTAGAVTNSTAYARMAICFITPPLLSVAGCLLFYAPDFNRNCLAATVLLYLAGLTHIARRGERGFREFSRIKNEATTLARSLSAANEHSTALAEQMRYRATHDQLTGLLNRAGFMEEVERLAPICCLPLCMMVLDLDGFKSVNDIFGHNAGDQILAEVAKRLMDVLGDAFVVARIGGDEFSIFYSLDKSEDLPSALATRLITAIEVPFIVFDPGHLGVSIGIYVTQTRNLTEMLTCADEALYAAKSAGRNRYYLFDDSLRRRLDMRWDIERDLAEALSDNVLEVWYQPVFGEDGRQLVNLEALIRWKHPRHGWIPPEDLISTASMAGFSWPLLRFVFDEVCVMIQMLQAHGLEHVWVAMNLSPRELSRIPFEEIIPATLKDRGLLPDMLEIEITEDTAIDVHSVQEKLRSLLDFGVRIAIDDFGAGYSSLMVLQRIRVSRIKIDRSFVTNLHKSTTRQILVQTILKLGYSLGVEVVAEGVESDEDLLLLRKFGCRLLQGYYLKSPAPCSETIDWFRAMTSNHIGEDRTQDLL